MRVLNHSRRSKFAIRGDPMQQVAKAIWNIWLPVLSWAPRVSLLPSLSGSQATHSFALVHARNHTHKQATHIRLSFLHHIHIRIPVLYAHHLPSRHTTEPRVLILVVDHGGKTHSLVYSVDSAKILHQVHLCPTISCRCKTQNQRWKRLSTRWT